MIVSVCIGADAICPLRSTCAIIEVSAHTRLVNESTQCNQIEYCANSHKKQHTLTQSIAIEKKTPNRPCEEDTQVKMPKNEIKSTKCEWQNENVRLFFVCYCCSFFFFSFFLFSNHLSTWTVCAIAYQTHLRRCEWLMKMSSIWKYASQSRKMSLFFLK